MLPFVVSVRAKTKSPQREDEGEQADGDQRVPADRHHDGQEGADQAGPVDPGCLDERGRDPEHERSHDQDPERDPAVALAMISPGMELSRPMRS